MDYHTISQDDREQQRLAVQSRLLYPIEHPILHRLSAGRTGLTVLDIGSNNGRKAVRWFQSPTYSRVIGLEFQDALAQEANKAYGGSSFAFHACNVEAPDFDLQLREIMASNQIASFDLIYLSFVLIHLHNPGKLLRTLRGCLAPGGTLVVVEPDDRIACLSPDPDGLLPAFLDILAQDPMAGNRFLGSCVQQLLDESGYTVVSENDRISAGPGEMAKKQDLFETFLSYLPEDLELLTAREPGSIRLRQWQDWMDSNYSRMQAQIFEKDSILSMGTRILTCTPKKEAIL